MRVVRLHERVHGTQYYFQHLEAVLHKKFTHKPTNRCDSKLEYSNYVGISRTVYLNGKLPASSKRTNARFYVEFFRFRRATSTGELGWLRV